MLFRSMAHQLGIEVFDEYSSEELTRIALECGNNVYHIEEDASYIEVLDSQTHHSIENGVGNVVGTNLLNRATPIIRYWQDDLVKLNSLEKCECGNEGRIIEEIQGREMDCIISDEQRIPASALMDMAYNWFLAYKIPIMGMRYQIVQDSKNKICIYLIKGMYDLTNQDLSKMKESMHVDLDRKSVV